MKKPVLQKVKSNVLKVIIPNRIKRLIFLTSLSAYIKDITAPDKVVLDKLNTLLQLSHDSNALKLPVLIKDRIWAEVDDHAIIQTLGLHCTCVKDINFKSLSQHQLRVFVVHVVRRMPDWLKYSSISHTKEDVRRLVYSISSLDGLNISET